MSRKKNIALKKHEGNSLIQAFCDSDFSEDKKEKRPPKNNTK
jgi:hypothetical protein